MVGRMDGTVLATIWSLILRSLRRWRQALEFFKPVEDDVDLALCVRRIPFLHHQQPLAEYAYGFRCSCK